MPILYLEKISDGVYIPYTRVSVVDDRPADLYFDLALSELTDLGTPSNDTIVERAYREAVVRQRMHQPRFRAEVLFAYKEKCAICGMPEPKLLDAAHIRGDKDPDGQPIVPNGLALCSIHHRAYDGHFIGIDGDRKLHVRPDIVEIVDGPVLASALQSLPGTWLNHVPKGKKAPDPYRLEKTFKEYLSALPT
ncbi:HNH endonuclease [Demequina oxidasica]|uniref:HNH endonuclease n=1 Tax=Demequina oxidasica TaxID=676199 RepID=UPI00078049A9|nr:HNH endonuclease [Demequina oxidasica]